MAITRTVTNSAANAATTVRDAIETILTTAGWTDLGSATAATCGTTAACDIWITPETTGPAASIYTGGILFIEADDTNQRIRFRLAEKYDSSAVGSPASMVTRPVPGCHQYQTPTAADSYTESYVALFQAAGISQSVGWANMACPNGTDFVWWFGANDRRFVFYTTYAQQYSNAAQFTMGGHHEILSTLTAGLFLLVGDRSSSSTQGSWTKGTGSGSSVANGRVSRMPGRSSTQTSGAFTVSTGSVGGCNNDGGSFGGWGGQAQAPTALSGPPLFKAYLHGAYSQAAVTPVPVRASSSADRGYGSHEGYIPELYLQHINTTDYGLAGGSTVTASGVDMLCVGTIYFGGSGQGEEQCGFVVDGDF